MYANQGQEGKSGETVIPACLAKALQLAQVKVEEEGVEGTVFPTLTAVSWRVRFLLVSWGPPYPVCIVAFQYHLGCKKFS